VSLTWYFMIHTMWLLTSTMSYLYAILLGVLYYLVSLLSLHRYSTHCIHTSHTLYTSHTSVQGLHTISWSLLVVRSYYECCLGICGVLYTLLYSTCTTTLYLSMMYLVYAILLVCYLYIVALLLLLDV
jgi:hypothetical protein